MSRVHKYDGWTFLVVPARWEASGQDPDELFLEECAYADREGWKIELQVAYIQTDEVVIIPIAYPEHEHLFFDQKEAAAHIRHGFALEDAMRSHLGDNLSAYRRLK